MICSPVELMNYIVIHQLRNGIARDNE